METTLPDETKPVEPQPERPPTLEVVLEDGSSRDLGGLSGDELRLLQWEQERLFARRILDSPKGSSQRADALCHAYDTVNRIVGARMAVASGGALDEPPVLGLDARHEQLTFRLLSRWRAAGVQPRFFEVGYGNGVLMRYLSERGFPVAGIEASASMRKHACTLLGPDHEQALLLGDFLSAELAGSGRGYHLVYWNDVFEHIPPDEVLDYLRKIHDLLVPGGQLVTITPNWHTRPSDVTGDVCRPRTEAAGLHLKEYTLREVTGLLRRAGFTHVSTPMVVVPGRIVLCGNGLAGCKRFFEPWLEWLPFRLARLLCRGFGLDCTMATKGMSP
ncbi:MAG: class I SAM-dependent methyltransferase [Pirellulales bacterium]|nr:class I SAM-dependent methyltransferase [Pirellulales bacterium]